MKTLLALLLLIPSLSWGEIAGKKIICIQKNTEYVSNYVKGFSFIGEDEVVHNWGIVREPWVGTFDYNYLSNSDLIIVHGKVKRLKDYPLLPQDRPLIIALFTLKDLILYDEYELLEQRDFIDPTFRQRTGKGECRFVKDEISLNRFSEIIANLAKEFVEK